MTATHSLDVLVSNTSAPDRTPSPLTQVLNRLQPSPETVVLLLAILIGTGTGMGVVTFHYLIHTIHSLMLEEVMSRISSWGAWTLACVPILGGLIVGLMRLVWPDFGPSMSSMIAATQGVRELLPIRPVAKMVAASVSLGTGASLGPEGPSVEIGANFGMLLGQILQVSRERHQLLLGAGAAAGLAAGFNAPIAGVFFALEVVLGTTFATSAVSVVLLAAVVSALIAQIGLGAQPAFALPVYEVRSPLELPLYLGLGVLASLVSLTYTQLTQLARRYFRGQLPGFGWMEVVPRSLLPIVGGACVGLVALHWPQIMGIGYETIEAMLQDVEFSLQLLVILLILKLIVTAISLGSGLVGGIFAPAMFLGASLGAAYGKVLEVVLPSAWSAQIAGPPAYAMVGMAAVLAGSARAPLTAILLLFELTRDYRIVLPLMAAVSLSVWLVERLKTKPSKGVTLPADLDIKVEKDQNLEILKQMLVAEAMNQPTMILNGSMPILEAGLVLTTGQCRSALVVDDAKKLIGIVTLQDINRAISRAEADSLNYNLTNQPLTDICTIELLSANPDEPMADALDRMAARGLHQLPVIDPDNPHQVLGVLEQENIALACSVAATRQALLRYLSFAPVPNELPLPTIEQPV